MNCIKIALENYYKKPWLPTEIHIVVIFYYIYLLPSNNMQNRMQLQNIVNILRLAFFFLCIHM